MADEEHIVDEARGRRGAVAADTGGTGEVVVAHRVGQGWSVHRLARDLRPRVDTGE